MFMIIEEDNTEYSRNTFTKTYLMVGDLKINRILISTMYLFVLWRNSQLNIKLFEREHYRISSITKIKWNRFSTSNIFWCIVMNLHLQAFS